MAMLARRFFLPAEQRVLRSKHIVALDDSTGARLRRVQERNEDGLFRTYELLPGSVGYRVPIRQLTEDEALAEADRLLDFWIRRVGPIDDVRRDGYGSVPPTAAELCAADRLLGLAKLRVDLWRERAPRDKDGELVPTWWLSMWSLGHGPISRVGDVLSADRREIGRITELYEGPPSLPLFSRRRKRRSGKLAARVLTPGRAHRLLWHLRHLGPEHDRLLAFLATQGALTVPVLALWYLGASTSVASASLSERDLRSAGDRAITLLDDLRNAGLVTLHCPVFPLPADPTVPEGLLRAWEYDLEGRQALRCQRLVRELAGILERDIAPLDLDGRHIPRSANASGADALSARLAALAAGTDPLGGEVASQCIAAFSIGGAHYLAARFLDVPGAARLAEPDLRPWLAARVAESIDERFFDPEGWMQEQIYARHLSPSGAPHRWWTNAGVSDRLHKWILEPRHSHVRQSVDLTMLRGWLLPDVAGGALHTAVLRAGTAQIWGEWQANPLLWAGIIDPATGRPYRLGKRPRPDGLHLLRVLLADGAALECPVMLETFILGGVDVRAKAARRDGFASPRRDADGATLRAKARGLWLREGPDVLIASDGAAHPWPLRRTPPLLVVVPGVLSADGCSVRDRARVLAFALAKEAWLLPEPDRPERVPWQPGDILAAICEREELRALGWCGPIWYIVRVPEGHRKGDIEMLDFLFPRGTWVSLDDPLAALEKVSLLDTHGLPILPTWPATAHDMAGLLEPWRRRLHYGSHSDSALASDEWEVLSVGPARDRALTVGTCAQRD
jgi:hypothetical protein